MGDKGDFPSFALKIRFSNSQVKHQSFFAPVIENNFEENLYYIKVSTNTIYQNDTGQKYVMGIVILTYILWNGVPEESKQSEEE